MWYLNIFLVFIYGFFFLILKEMPVKFFMKYYWAFKNMLGLQAAGESWVWVVDVLVLVFEHFEAFIVLLPLWLYHSYLSPLPIPFFLLFQVFLSFFLSSSLVCLLLTQMCLSRFSFHSNLGLWHTSVTLIFVQSGTL